MKKFLKTFIVILLVVCAVGGTAYFFFRNIKEENNTTQSLVDMLNSTSKIEFNADLRTMNSIVNSDGTDARLEILITTNDSLDEIVYALASYYVKDSTKVNNENIATSLRSVLASRRNLELMIDEYLIKKDSAYFNRHLGANDFYRQMASYLKNYSRFARLLNNSISLPNKTNDAKFAMIELYTDVVTSTFVNLSEDERIEILNNSNINEIHSRISTYNFNIESNVNSFSENGNNFVKYYNKCNKQDLAKNISTYISSVTAVTEESSNEEIATYYYKLYFGI